MSKNIIDKGVRLQALDKNRNVCGALVSIQRLFDALFSNIKDTANTISISSFREGDDNFLRTDDTHLTLGLEYVLNHINDISKIEVIHAVDFDNEPDDNPVEVKLEFEVPLVSICASYYITIHDEHTAQVLEDMTRKFVKENDTSPDFNILKKTL